MDTNIIWDNEELEVIEELNEIFNLQEGETMTEKQIIFKTMQLLLEASEVAKTTAKTYNEDSF